MTPLTPTDLMTEVEDLHLMYIHESYFGIVSSKNWKAVNVLIPLE